MNDYHNRCRWISAQNKLHIDLSDLLNDTRILVLTGFTHSQGITLSLIADEGIEHYVDPFSAPYFPILDVLDYGSCHDYLDQIPAEVMQTLKPYRAESFGLLMLLSHHKKLSEFCGKYCTPFWLLFRQAKIGHWSKQQFISLCESGIFNVLNALNLPTNHATVELLNKMTASHGYTKFHVDLIQQTFIDLDYCHLNSILETVPDHLLQFLLRYPHLQHVKFLSQLEREDYYVFRDCIKRLRSALLKHGVDNVNQQLATVLASSDSLNALRTYEKRVSDATR